MDNQRLNDISELLRRLNPRNPKAAYGPLRAEAHNCIRNMLLENSKLESLASVRADEIRQLQLANRIFSRSLNEVKNELDFTGEHLSVARQAMNQCRLAFAGHVSGRSAIDKLDEALARLEQFSKRAKEESEPSMSAIMLDDSNREPPAEPEVIQRINKEAT